MLSLFSEKYGEVHYDQSKNLIVMVWKGDFTDDIYQKFWNVTLDKVMERNVRRIIIDQRTIGYVPMQSRAWFLIKFLPRFRKQLASDIMHVGVIASKHVFHNTGLQYLLQGAKKLSNFNISMFLTMEEALESVAKS